MSPFVRTVLGDVDPAALSGCDAHEHAWIGPSYAADRYPDFRIDQVDPVVAELRSLRAAGIDWLIDCMPGGAGRDVSSLAKVSQASGVAIVAATGVHLARYYPPEDPLLAESAAGLAGRFVREIENGADGVAIRCGVIKVAGGKDALSAFERRVFAAAGEAHRVTGCPIITHTENGSAATEQVDLLLTQGRCDPSRVTLSHVDRVIDPDYHRALLARGVTLEYDGHFRWKDRSPNPTIELIAALLPEYPGQIVVGMDAARPAYWHSFSGRPGLAWLATTLRERLLDRGVTPALLDRLYIDNPRRAFSFTRPRP